MAAASRSPANYAGSANAANAINTAKLACGLVTHLSSLSSH